MPKQASILFISLLLSGPVAVAQMTDTIVLPAKANLISRIGDNCLNKIADSTDKLNQQSAQYKDSISKKLTQYPGRITSKTQKVDSTLERLQQIPNKYITDIDKKIDRYTSRVTSKTEKTLTKLSRWENKIKGLLQKASPAAAERLFNNNQLSFNGMLQKLKQGEAISTQYRAQYDGYRDKLTTDLKYLQTQKENINSKLIKPLDNAGKKMAYLNEEEDKSAAMQQFIKERKRQLISESIQYIGNSKFLTKINKESFYYVETLKNYKEIFN